MIEVSEHPPVRHTRPGRFGFKVGIMGRLRPWLASSPVGDPRPPIILLEATFEASGPRQAAAKALRLLHGGLPWYSWQLFADLGRRRVRA